MFKALEQAQIAKKNGEVPIGAVIMKNEKIISAAFNQKEKLNDPTAHAEIMAVRLACKKLKNWRLIDCKIYVTMRPCLMCLHAIKNARINEIVFAINRPEKENEFENEIFREICFRNKINIISGVLKEKSLGLISSFFDDLRT